MAQAVKSIFSPPKPPKPDTSLIEAQKKDLADRQAKADAADARQREEQNRALGLQRRRRQSRASLITGLQTGVPEKRETLG